MERSFRFTDVRTIQFAWVAMASIIIGWALDAMTDPLWVRFGIHANALEQVGSTFALSGYWLLWVLLPVAAFRPENRFYWRGDCFLRAKRCSLILGILVVVHLWIIVSVAFMLR